MELIAHTLVGLKVGLPELEFQWKMGLFSSEMRPRTHMWSMSFVSCGKRGFFTQLKQTKNMWSFILTPTLHGVVFK
jgi:hypothetical protein